MFGSMYVIGFFFFNDTAPTEIYTLSLHDALPISGPAGVDPYVAADGPAQLPQPLLERPDAGLIFRIVRGCGQEHADALHALLRTRRERPCYRAAECRDEVAPPHAFPGPKAHRNGSNEYFDRG